MKNPYLKMVNRLSGKSQDFFFYKDGSIRIGLSLREKLVKKYSWAIPDDNAIEVISKYGPIIEIGAGKGYWAKEISNKTEIVAFDLFSTADNNFTDKKENFYPIQLIEQHPEVIKFNFSLYSNHTLFLCWPPLDSSMARIVLESYQGEYFVFVGESAGGCTGCDEFFEILESKWNLIESHKIPKYTFLNDRLYVFQKKKI